MTAPVPIGALTDDELTHLRKLMDAASAGLVMGSDYIGAMLSAGPKLLATIAARDSEVAELMAALFEERGAVARVAQLEAALSKLCAFIEAARRLALDDGEEDDRVSGSKMNVALSPWEVVKLLGDLAPIVEAPNEDWDYARLAMRTK